MFERAGFDVPSPPWPRMTHAEAVSRFGSDRPDTRFGLELKDLGEALRATEFKVFADTLGAGGVVRGINAGARELPRSELDGLTEIAKRFGAKGLVWAFVQDGRAPAWRSPIAKFLSAAEIAAVNSRLEAGPGDLLLIVADQAPTAAQVLGALRLELAARFDLVPAGLARHPLDRAVPDVRLAPGGAALGCRASSVHGPGHRRRGAGHRRRSGRSRNPALALLRPCAGRQRDRRRVDP